MNVDKLDNVENLVVQKKFVKAEKAISALNTGLLDLSLHSKFFYFVALINFELEKDDQVMPYLNKIFQSTEKFEQIDKAYLLAGSYYVAKANSVSNDKEDHLHFMRESEIYYKKIDAAKLNKDELATYYFERALIEQSLERTESSIDYFESALKYYDTVGDQQALHEYLAEAYNDINQYELAIKHYDIAIEMSPPTEEINIAYLSLSKARILDSLGRMEQANKILFNILDKFGEGKKKEDFVLLMYCYEVLGLTHSSLKDFKASIHYFKKAIHYAKRTEKDVTPYLYDITGIYRELKDFEIAHKMAEKALNSCKSDFYEQLIYVELSRIYRDTKQYKKTIEILKKLVEKYPNYEDLGWANVKIGNMYTVLNDYKEAIVYLEHALTILTVDDEFYITAKDLMAFCYLKLDKIDDAFNICTYLVKRFPDGPDLAWTHAVLARCYFEMGMKIEAREEAEKVQKFRKPSTEVYLFAEEVLEDILKDLGIE